MIACTADCITMSGCLHTQSTRQLLNIESFMGVKILQLYKHGCQMASNLRLRTSGDPSFDFLLCRRQSNKVSGQDSHRHKSLIKPLLSSVKPTADPLVPAQTCVRKRLELSRLGYATRGLISQQVRLSRDRAHGIVKCSRQTQ